MNKDKIIFSIGILISLIVSGTCGFLYYKNELIIKSEKLMIQVAATQTPIPTAMPQEKIDYKNQKIEVLNGSGKKGFAKSFADKLFKLGFTRVITGNYTEIITGNILFAPTDIGNEINLEEYKYQNSKDIKIILGN